MAEQHPHEDLGYRVLSESEQEAVRKIRTVSVALDALVGEIADSALAADPRWLAIAKTHFQEGLMAATRSVTKPTFF
jgi:ribonucleotide reductase beta subunit family protein with ferritin-like domain